MRPHISIYVKSVPETISFYEKVFAQSPQKKTHDYAKFDLKNPALNFSFMSTPEGQLSQVSHFGIEVDSLEEVLAWKNKLNAAGVTTRDEMGTDCCYARQDKVWFEDPNGNAWEVFFVAEQLAIPTMRTKTTCNPKTGCC